MFDVFNKQLNAFRYGQDTLIEGDIIPGLEEQFIIQASVQPTPYEDMMVLPEGYRTTDTFTLYTSTELKTARTGYLPDVVVINTQKFRVIKVAVWQNNIIPHYEVIVARIDNDNVNQ
jgi:hypothetical protein